MISRLPRLAIGLAVTGGCVAWIVLCMTRDRSIMQVAINLRFALLEADFRTLPIFWSLLCAFYMLKAWRWSMLLSPLGEYRPCRDLAGPMMMGFAFNNVFPARLGELVRAFTFARTHQQPMASILATLVLERLFDVCALLLLFGVGTFAVHGNVQLADLPGWLINSLSWGVCGAVCGALVIFVALAWSRRCLSTLDRGLARLPIIGERYRRKFSALGEASRTGLIALRQQNLLVRISAISIVKWCLNVLLIHLSLRSFGVVVPAGASAIVAGSVAVAVAVPSSPGYIGVVQVVFVAVLGLFIHAEEAVLGASVYYHAAQYVPVTAVGLWYWFRTGMGTERIPSEGKSVRRAN